MWVTSIVEFLHSTTIYKIIINRNATKEDPQEDTIHARCENKLQQCELDKHVATSYASLDTTQFRCAEDGYSLRQKVMVLNATAIPGLCMTQRDEIKLKG